jgi:hypothetical protein
VDERGTANGGRRRFGEAEVSHLAFLDQQCHGAHRFFDRYARVHPVLVIQIDMTDSGSLETRIACATHVLGASVDAEECAVRTAHAAKFGGEHDLVTPRLQHLSQQALIGTETVRVGGIQKVDADIEGGVEDAQIGGLIRRAIELRHAHAAEPDG